jgi:hypothetical protein
MFRSRSVRALTCFFALLLLSTMGGAMTFPADPVDVQVTIAFDGSTPVDVTAYALSEDSPISRTYGRGSGDASSASPGKVPFRLTTHHPTAPLPAGTWNPRDPTGAYWQPRGWLGAEVVITVEGEDWFTGPITRWAPSWGLDGTGYADVEASGPLQLALQGRRSLSPLSRTVLASDPVVYLPLTDGVRADVGTNATPNAAPATLGDIAWDAVDGPAGDERKLPELLSEAEDVNFAPAVTMNVTGTGTSWTVELSYRAVPTPGAAAPYGLILRWITAGTATAWILQADANSGLLSLIGANSAGGWEVDAGNLGLSVIDGAWHRIRIVAEQDGPTLHTYGYLDGALAFTDFDTTTAGELTAVTVYGADATTSGLDSASIGHIAVWADEPALSADDSDWAQAGWIGEPAGDRIGRVCVEAGIPVDIDPGDTEPAGVQPTGGVLDVLRDAEGADLGRLGETPAGAIRYTPREARYNATASLTLSAEHLTDVPIPADEYGKRVGDVEAKRPDAGSARVRDDEVMATGGVERTFDVNTSTDGRLPAFAQWLLRLLGGDDPPVSDAAVDLAADGGSLVAGWLATIAAAPVRITVDPLPGIPDGIDAFIEGWAETITTKGWMARLNLSPGAPYDVEVLDTGGWLDCGATTTNEALDSTETGVDILIEDTCVWTHADGDYDITIGGERMTVIAVSAVTGAYPTQYQTLTVVRAVNGVVKSHPSGSEVHVTVPAVLAL